MENIPIHVTPVTKNILKKVVYGIVVVILITLLMSFDWFPKMVGTIGIIIVIAITLAFIASDLLDNYSRSNLVWSQFTQPSDPAMLADQLAQGDQGSIWEANKKSFSKLYAGAKSSASAGLTSIASGDAAASATGALQGVADTAVASGGQVQASTSQTSEGFAPF